MNQQPPKMLNVAKTTMRVVSVEVPVLTPCNTRRNYPIQSIRKRSGLNVLFVLRKINYIFLSNQCAHKPAVIVKAQRGKRQRWVSFPWHCFYWLRVVPAEIILPYPREVI